MERIEAMKWLGTAFVLSGILMTNLNIYPLNIFLHGSPLVHAKRMDEVRLVSISEELNRTPAQVLIRWAMQRGMVVLPKSVNKDRIIENFSVL